MKPSLQSNYIADIKLILKKAREEAYRSVNTALIKAYWLTGRRIVEEEQQGEERAAYGKEIIKNLSSELTLSLGRGFSERSIREIRQFYLAFQELFLETENNDFEINPIWRTVFAKLHWSHYQRVLRIKSDSEKFYYLTEAAEQNWSITTLDRNISTLYYQRILSSKNKEIVHSEMQEKSDILQNNPRDFIKSPTILEFLDLSTSYAYTEQDLEKSLIDNIQQFLLELGKGFAFVGRQKHIRTETQDFFIDLVFYNYILKCFVIVELKTDKLTHQDIGQLDMYVRMFDDIEKRPEDNPTIGILLCTETDQTIVKYSVLSENDRLFANKYLAYLPTEEELAREIERERSLLQEKWAAYHINKK